MEVRVLSPAPYKQTRILCLFFSKSKEIHALYPFLSPMNHFFYFARCADKSLYAGYRTDIQKREDTHNSGKGAKYTAGRRPIKIIYWEAFETKTEAMQREAEIKKWSKSKKEGFINEKL